MLLHSSENYEFNVEILQSSKESFKGTQKENFVLLQYKSYSGWGSTDA